MRALVAGLLFGALSISRLANAHPLLQDGVRVEVGARSILLEITTTLAGPVAARHTSSDGPALLQPAEVDTAIAEYGAYLLEHTELSLDRVSLTGHVIDEALPDRPSGPVHARLEADRIPVQYRLRYDREGSAQILSLSHSLFEDREERGGQPWRVTWTVGVFSEGTDQLLGSFVLPPGMRFSVELPAAEEPLAAPEPGRNADGSRAWLLPLLVAALGAGAVLVARRRPRLPGAVPRR